MALLSHVVGDSKRRLFTSCVSTFAGDCTSGLLHGGVSGSWTALRAYKLIATPLGINLSTAVAASAWDEHYSTGYMKCALCMLKRVQPCSETRFRLHAHDMLKDGSSVCIPCPSDSTAVYLPQNAMQTNTTNGCLIDQRYQSLTEFPQMLAQLLAICLAGCSLHQGPAIADGIFHICDPDSQEQGIHPVHGAREV